MHHVAAARADDVCGIIIFSGIVYWGIGWTKTVFGAAASWILGVALLAAYVALMRYKAGHPDLPHDDLSKAIVKVPDFFDTARTGLHYLLPVIVLIWCLMVEELSPGLSAFWGTAFLIFIMLTQRPLVAAFRGEQRVRRARARRLRRSHRRLPGRLAQHDVGRHRHRHRRHHRRHGLAHRHRPGDDRDRRDRIRRQSDDHAGDDGGDLPHPRHGHADHGELCRGRHADGAGAGRTRRRERSRRAAGRGASVRVLFRPDGRRHAAGRACGLCRGGDLRRRSGEDRHPGLPLRSPHRRCCPSSSSSTPNC